MECILSGITGFAVGDALGVPVEFLDRGTLKQNKVTEMLGYGSHDVDAGTWSDDTSMTLAVLDSLAEKGDIDCNDMANKFCDWINDAKYTATDIVFDVGITTKYALIKFLQENCDAVECGGSGFNDNGNGSLMRMLPIAFFCYFKQFDGNAVFKAVKDASSVTHRHEISIMGCYIYVRFVMSLIDTRDKFKSYDFIRKIDYNKYFSLETIEIYSRILDTNIAKLKENEINSSGYVVSTLEAALWTFLNSDSYEDAVITAVNLGSDTDTVGAITGSLSGILYGLNAIPDRWLSKLIRREYIKELCDKFSSFFEK